jgi:hypothetical protein
MRVTKLIPLRQYDVSSYLVAGVLRGGKKTFIFTSDVWAYGERQALRRLADHVAAVGYLTLAEIRQLWGAFGKVKCHESAS